MNAHTLFGVLCLRADARPETGAGHVMRCLALAQAWQDRGGSAVFVTATETPALLARLDAEECKVHRLQAAPASPADAAETLAIAGQLGAPWIVVDGYAFTAAYPHALRRDKGQVLVIDDLATEDWSAAQLIVNPNLQATAEMYAGYSNARFVLAGSRYALLRREFRVRGGEAAKPAATPQVTAAALKGEALRLVVTMGGSDPPNATGRLLEILSGIDDRRLHVTVIAGPANTHVDKLRALGKSLRSRHDVELLVDPPDLSTVLSRADLAISSAGTSCWELASLGVPLAVVVVAENQLGGAEALAKRGVAVFLGRHDVLDAPTVLAQLRALFDHPALRRRMSGDARTMIDGRGAPRVAERMAAYPLQLRPVTAADARLLHAWANDPLTRRMSFSGEAIPWESHLDWLNRRLEDPDCRFLVVLDAQDRPLGQARLDRSGSRATLSFSLAPEARGRGLAARLVRLAAVDSLLAGWCQTVDAWVRPENVPSMAAFRRAGYTDQGVPPEQAQPERSQGGASLFSLS